MLAQEAGDDLVGALAQPDRGLLFARARALLELGPRSRWPLPTGDLDDRAAHAVAVATLRLWARRGGRLAAALELVASQRTLAAAATVQHFELGPR